MHSIDIYNHKDYKLHISYNIEDIVSIS